ncbi:MAG: hypothetical protein MHM6MM_001430 [Cercozoa sp. M6MM]
MEPSSPPKRRPGHRPRLSVTMTFDVKGDFDEQAITEKPLAATMIKSSSTRSVVQAELEDLGRVAHGQRTTQDIDAEVKNKPKRFNDRVKEGLWAKKETKQISPRVRRIKLTAKKLHSKGKRFLTRKRAASLEKDTVKSALLDHDQELRL